MLRRLLVERRDIRLSNGIEISTPLVIPSLSTRNVGRLDQEGSDGKSEPPVSYASGVLETLGNHIDEALLVSAYDLHYRSLHESDRLLNGESPTCFHHPNLLMLDSGLYETRERVGYDDGYEQPKAWSPEMYFELLAQLPDDFPGAIVNYDLNADQLSDPKEMSYGAQIARAREFFAAHSGPASVCLLKPEHSGGFIDCTQLSSVAAELKEFDIVAITEKELGNTLRQRFDQLADLHRLLKDRGVRAPIHVFGGLDPSLTPIYVACGAEIVDGVGWLRYSYSDEDTATYIESRPLLTHDLDSRVPIRLFKTLSDNLTYLRSMKRRLELLLDTGNWRGFSERHGEALEGVVAQVLSNQEVK